MLPAAARRLAFYSAVPDAEGDGLGPPRPWNGPPNAPEPGCALVLITTWPAVRCLMSVCVPLALMKSPAFTSLKDADDPSIVYVVLEFVTT